MKTKREVHKALIHAQGHLVNCKTAFLLAESIINNLLEGELKKQRKDDQVSEEFNKKINDKLEG